MDCPNRERCPIYDKFKTEALKNIYIKMFCLGKYDNCKRKQIKDNGGQVPIDLLPDGKSLQDL